MRQRALIHVGGPPRAGKTAFVETVLAHSDANMIMAVRCRRDDSLSEPREGRPRTDPELRRYPAAGACAAAQYSFPGGDDAQDAFFMAGFMEDYSEAVLLEGDNPVGFVDVTVYVAQASGGRLLVRGKRDRTGEGAGWGGRLGCRAPPARWPGPAAGEARRWPRVRGCAETFRACRARATRGARAARSAAGEGRSHGLRCAGDRSTATVASGTARRGQHPWRGRTGTRRRAAGRGLGCGRTRRSSTMSWVGGAVRCRSPRSSRT